MWRFYIVADNDAGYLTGQIVMEDNTDGAANVGRLSRVCSGRNLINHAHLYSPVSRRVVRARSAGNAG